MNNAKMTLHYFMTGKPFGYLSSDPVFIKAFNQFSDFIVWLDDKWLDNQ